MCGVCCFGLTLLYKYFLYLRLFIHRHTKTLHLSHLMSYFTVICIINLWMFYADMCGMFECWLNAKNWSMYFVEQYTMYGIPICIERERDVFYRIAISNVGFSSCILGELNIESALNYVIFWPRQKPNSNNLVENTQC